MSASLSSESRVSALWQLLILHCEPVRRVPPVRQDGQLPLVSAARPLSCRTISYQMDFDQACTLAARMLSRRANAMEMAQELGRLG